MSFRVRAILLLAALALGVLLTYAQDAEAPLIDPLSSIDPTANVAITFPPPVYTVRGSIQIVGTADTPALENYRVEFRPLELPDPTQPVDPAQATPEEAPWFPATLPRNQAVRDDVLGTWNTTTARDGLYEIRLVVNEVDGSEQIFRLSPLRIENDPSEFALMMLGLDESGSSSGDQPALQPTPTQLGGFARPTLQPTPTSLNSGQPIVTSTVDANVRQGDDTSYPVVGALLAGEQASVIGISSTGSGWFYIQLSNGRRGFVAPGIVAFNGNVASLTRINPPPPPTPTATPTPTTRANLVISGLRLDPVQPDCGESFEIFINVTNNGTGPTSSSGTLSIIDRHVASGGQQGDTNGGFPVLNPGDNFVVVAVLTINTFFEEQHDIIVTLDPSNQIAETNESDNTQSLRYTLDQAGCG